ncbi:MAG: phosphatase PAP2 family protein [Actinobacteria bacterium]|nr:phosphatase PAP2 family protein [Actinomycetota bacterium]
MPESRRMLLLALASLVGAAVLFVLVGWEATVPAVKEVDDAVHRAVEGARGPLLTAVATAFHWLGTSFLLLPLRVAIGVLLAARRRLRALAAWLVTWATVEIVVGAAKIWLARPRPPGPLIAATGGSFPSGHAASAAATAFALALLLGRPGRRRRWVAGAAVYSAAMALSRVYLGAHWLSDVVAGTLLGIALGVAPAALADEEGDAPREPG